MFLSVSDRQRNGALPESRTAAEARRRKFIQALVWIDLALFLVIVDRFPLHATLPGGGSISFTGSLRHIFLLSAGVVLATVGVFLLVDTFYAWSGDTRHDREHDSQGEA